VTTFTLSIAHTKMGGCFFKWQYLPLKHQPSVAIPNYLDDLY
jgi:hypothetical protein